MNAASLLDTILAMLHSIKDDRAKLEKLYEFMERELYEEEKEVEQEAPQIPEKYRALVKEVAEWVGTEMVCYINPATLELVLIPTQMLNEIDLEEDLEEGDYEFDDYAEFRKDLKRIETEWKNTVSVGPPEPHESFRFMERFVSTVTDVKLTKALNNALSRSKPFRNFNAIIHESVIRDEWFSFKQKCLEEYVANEIIEELQKSSPESE